MGRGDESVQRRSLYTPAFFIVYVAQTLLLLGQALTFRMSDVVKFLGGDSVTLGLLVASGLLSATICRFLLAPFFSRVPIKRLWLLFAFAYLLGNFVFLFETTISTWVYLGRAVFVIGYAGMIVCSYTFIQRFAPEERRAEAVGMLGQSTFVGLIGGAFLGDWLIEGLGLPVTTIFWALTAIGVFYGAAVIALPSTKVRTKSNQALETPPTWPLRYFLGALTLGAQIGFVSFFLLTFLQAKSLASMGPFFLVYCISAFCFRMVSRRWLDRVGSRTSSLVGLVSLVLGQLSFFLVTESFHLALPAVLCAAGRAYLEPGVIIEISRARGSKGSGTLVALATVDTGIMLGALAFGFLNDISSAGPVLACVALSVLSTAAMLSPALPRKRIRQSRRPATSGVFPLAKPL